MPRARGSGEHRAHRPCLLCAREGAEATLCPEHEAPLAAAIVTAEQLRDRVDAPVASLIGPGGHVLGVADGAVIGRGADAAIGIADESVSIAHARLDRDGARWRVVDLHSRAGTSVARVPVAAATLEPGDLLRFGGVPFYFWPTVVRAPARTRRRATPLMNALAFRVVGASGELIVPYVDTGATELSRREHLLLALLAQRAAHVAHPERAFVETAELAASLGYDAVWGDENVRELVHRLRTKLAGVGLGDLIEHARGAGYRLAATVTLAG